MHEQIIRPVTVCGGRCIQPVNSAAAVGIGIRYYLNEIVRGGGCDTAHRFIFHCQNVALAAKSVIGRADERVPIGVC